MKCSVTGAASGPRILKVIESHELYFGHLFESDLGLGAPAVCFEKAGGHPTSRAESQVSFKRS